MSSDKIRDPIMRAAKGAAEKPPAPRDGRLFCATLCRTKDRIAYLVAGHGTVAAS
jgi:hypothetical protein